jgi:hypothetical protein
MFAFLITATAVYVVLDFWMDFEDWLNRRANPNAGRLAARVATEVPAYLIAVQKFPAVDRRRGGPGGVAIRR